MPDGDPTDAPPSPALRLWGGRFSSGPSDALAALSLSVHFDWRLAQADLRSSMAHARVLHRAGLLDADELDRMLHALRQLSTDVAHGSFVPQPDDEDVHTALERGLVERLGTLGGKLRAGRSRNDQVATDLRLYLRDAAREVALAVGALQDALLTQAQVHIDTVAPGFTHLQHAQPVSFGHELLKHVHALGRDIDRLRDWDARAAFSPLGAGALAGSSIPLDPEATAAELGFDAACANSIDAVSDRDFVAEFLFCTAMIGVHLSRLGEEVVLWTSREFGWATLDDAYSTGSSIMPQKKNPDVAELARGKAGRVYGHLMAILATMKGLPLSYNRDLQEDKEGLFDSVDTLLSTLEVFAAMMGSLRVKGERTRSVTEENYTLATDLADYLVKKGIPFRQAHTIVGKLVRYAIENKKALPELDIKEYKTFSPKFEEDVKSITVESSLAARDVPGGTAPEQVRMALAAARRTLNGS